MDQKKKLAFLRVSPAGPAMPGSRLPDLPSASPTPETLVQTALAPPPAPPPPVPAPPPAPLPAQPSQSSQSSSSRPQHPPPTLPSSDSKRPRLPGKGTSSTGHTGYMSHFSDSTRPIGTAAPDVERLGRGPYTKGKDDKGTFKGKDKFLHDWPPKGFPKGFPKGLDKGKRGSSSTRFRPRCQSPFSGPTLTTNFLLTLVHIRSLWLLLSSLWPAVSLGILSSSQHGSSPIRSFSLLLGASLSLYG